MRSRFPHGGEVLGAAPANPILAPVLSQDRGLSMSRQRDLLDLQAIQRIPGLVGYWQRDPQYMFEDSAGTTPASTSGTGPVGQWRSVGNAPSLGPILNSNSDCASALPFAKTDENGSVSTLSLNTANPISGTQDARLVITTSYDGRPYLVPTGFAPANNVVGATYRLQFDYKVNSGTFRILALYSGGSLVTVNTSLTGSGTFSYDLTCAGTSSYIGTIYCGNYTCDVQLDNVKIQQLSGIIAYQSTTANKPILRKTPTTGVYWADSNTSTSALNVALGNLGSACTVARSSAEGVTFTENVSITSTYNIAPAYGFNSDVAIFNRALTTTEKALITRYMQRAVPLLGNNVVTNGTFDDGATGWSVGTNWSIGGGIATKTGGVGGGVTQAYTLPVGSFYAIRGDFTVTAGAFNFHVGGSQVPPSITSSSSGLYIVARSAGPNIGVNGNTSSVGTLDNLSFRQIL